MAENRTDVTAQVKRLTKELDSWVSEGEYDTLALEKVQNKLNRAYEKLDIENNARQSNYIVYECQSLIHWLAGEEEDAYDLIRSAYQTKGDDQLFTQTGRQLLANTLNSETEQSSKFKDLPWWVATAIASFAFIIVFLIGVYGPLSTALQVVAYIFYAIGIFTALRQGLKSEHDPSSGSRAAAFIIALCVALLFMGIHGGLEREANNKLLLQNYTEN